MKNTNQKSFLYLDSGHLYFVYPGLEKPIKFNYPPKAISDLEINDRSLLVNGLDASLFSQKVTPGPLIIILSKNITFQKKMEIGTQEETKQEFLESIPFENVSIKHYNAHNGGPLLVTNKDFFQEFQTIFSARGFSIEAIIPEAVLTSSTNSFNPKQINSYATLHLTASLVHSLSLIGVYNRYEPRIQRIARKQFALNKNLRTLIIVFIFALLILAGSFAYSRIKYSRPIPEVSRPVVVTPVKMVTDDPLLVNIRIYYFGKNEKQARTLQSNLWAAGFKNTDLVASSSAIIKSNLFVSSQLSTNITQQIRLELDKVDRNYSLMQTSNSVSESSIFLSSPAK
ncbi:hypothetical protein A3K29_02705 [Candidatus Collierbacteria bacterium RIFOXYB2_FULL_46_14]|uniref:LytR/CpsA/Psr regulator C-terminal domain-containing protein n=1 Tax=Candidatus Collierbacteria bacterium GW2011_GWA2_46_26 TaxID=1618381 RepID=A0A0G1PMI4_9BACT|nr:MAG: hypothetical protein UW29_C0004G0046 [Candidatus Collierbacteria bacterium GW2011_GWC2_44_13]KKU33902.1 MAG: hypothetical protein UX47_C0001G0185 [Candidatus Collierbacteria bacterium GW2011_GWA2_46_26]OGD73029.1 MAG: hypothetical protein A3K29_02705 [Candidatus Collierbacteria bacterium RIFOXYB2_FULL_46_14]OGD76071.1 MAG: hypothetical protein A3K43_02705 [Candidatus Collierbacteria bacterium RIFOXYA2_FULL_46_20]OGD77407.1 MAG: hypothetical protein A3K39_02705 [Candidatus Collierbacteri